MFVEFVTHRRACRWWIDYGILCCTAPYGNGIIGTIAVAAALYFEVMLQYKESSSLYFAELAYAELAYKTQDTR